MTQSMQEHAVQPVWYACHWQGRRMPCACGAAHVHTNRCADAHMAMHGSVTMCDPGPKVTMGFIRCASCFLCPCRHEGQSRYIACSQLRGDMDDARAMAVASGMLRASALPSSCAHLKRPEQLQPLVEQWSISWSDMPLRHRKSGLIRYTCCGQHQG